MLNKIALALTMQMTQYCSKVNFKGLVISGSKVYFFQCLREKNIATSSLDFCLILATSIFIL